jgi:cytochrome c oxidase cbb3-type subunit 3
MSIRNSILRAVLVLIPAMSVQGQQPPATPPPGGAVAQPGGRGGAQPGGGQPGGRQGGGPNFPQQQRKLADPAVLARGKGLYESVCAACHGIDLRGGQQGGPNLLRSQVVLLDKSGELIGQVVTAGRPKPAGGATPMPAFPLPPEDITAIAEYLHSVAAMAGRQGRPPEGAPVAPERVLVGDATAGQAYFTANCSSCHSVTGDLAGIARRAGDPRELQNLWVSGGGGGRGGRGRGGRGGRGGGATDANREPAMVTVTPASGPAVEGRLVRVDDFTVTLIEEDGSRRTFTRRGAEPKVEIRDPADAHRKLIQALTDTDMHNVTAYLWTVK